MIRRLLLVATVIVGVLSIGGPSYAGGYEESCGFVFDPPVIDPGGEVNILGSGFTPGSEVDFFIEDVLLGTATVDDDADGNVEATFFLPEEFDIDGEYTVTVECTDGAVASNVLIVGVGFVTTTTAALVPQPPVSAAPLPVTGSDSADLVRIGVGLLLVGGAVLALSRRRAHTATTVSA